MAMSRASLVLVAAAFALLSGSVSAQTSSLSTSDTGILNFALNLEYLEAQFYSCAAFGVKLPSRLVGRGAGRLSGCKRAALSTSAQAYAESIALDEIAHVALLRTVLGTKAVSMPDINIGTAFADAADLAVKIAKVSDKGLKPKFDAYKNDILFYHAAFIFEDVGVTAYKGAANKIQNKVILEAAAGILGVEAYHGGSIRTLLLREANTIVQPYGLPVKSIVGVISGLRAFASGKKDDLGLFRKSTAVDTSNLSGVRLPPADIAVIAPTDDNAVAFSRDVNQVLKIVYLGGTTKGGFFPSGIRTVPPSGATINVVVGHDAVQGGSSLLQVDLLGNTLIKI